MTTLVSRLLSGTFAVALGLAACRATSDAAPAPSPEELAAQHVAAPRAVPARADTSRDAAAFEALMRWKATQPAARLATPARAAVAFGEQVLGAPYVAGLLDAPDEETLLAPLDRFDCVLFVEAMLALARTSASGAPSYADYLARVEAQRYRGGVMDGYTSRLHYFSSWIDDNAARGLVEDVTATMPGAAEYRKPLSFMTTRRASYPRLVTPEDVAAVRAAEDAASAVARSFVPKARVRAAYDALETGDVIATTTTLPGMDVSHVGFAVKDASGRVGFLHASPQGGVKLSPDLAVYLAGNRAQTGVFVVRPR